MNFNSCFVQLRASNYKWTSQSGTLTAIFIFLVLIPVITYGFKMGMSPFKFSPPSISANV